HPLYGKCLIVGIDPDTDKSGVATYYREGRRLEIDSLSFFELYEYLMFAKEHIKTVRIEAGYLNSKSNFHGAKNVHTAAKTGSSVGACNMVAKMIVDLCKYIEVPYKEIKPFRKIWKKGKISHDELQNLLKKMG